MDGTYGNPIGRSQSPAPGTPLTPSAQYQVNISRKKTRKWVEAKVQSYDGDDWGGDDSGDEHQHEPVPPVPQQPTATSSRLPSETRRQFSQPTFPDPSGATALPPHIETQNQEAGAASSYAQPRAPFDAADKDNTQRSIGYSLQDPGSAVPANQLSRQDDGPISAQAQDASRAESSSSPQLPNVFRSSGFGTDMFATSLNESTGAGHATEQQESPAGKPSVQDVSHDSLEPSLVPQAHDAHDAQPELASGTAAHATPSTSEHPAQTTDTAVAGGAATRPSLPGGWVTETPSNAEDSSSNDKAQSGSDNETTKPQPGQNQDTPPTTTNENVTSSDAERDDLRTLPVLQTAVPQSSPPTALPESSGQPPIEQPQQRPSHDSNVADIPPTQPLQPRKPEYSPTDYDLQPIHRQVTESTVTSSPVKESDVLRDEIMRSLSPEKEDFAVGKPPAPTRQDTQQSNYSLGGYDDYWAGAAASQNLSLGQDATPAGDRTDEGVPTPFAAPQEVKGLALNTQSEAKDASLEPASASRQRFSWEMGKPAVTETDEKSKPLDAHPIASPTEPAVLSPTSDTSDSTAKDGQIPVQPASPALPSPPSQSISPQPSTLNAALAAKEKTSLPEPPSPVSAISEQQASSGRNSVPGEQLTLVTSPTPPPAVNIDPASPTTPTAKQSQPPIMAFRDIMGMPTAAERIEKYDETREMFAKMDSGLENWMTHLKVQHPEHADQTSSFYGAGLQAQGSGLSLATAGGSQPSQQQPYYQQYLNASSPAVNAPATNRARFAPAPVSSQGATSAFGSSGNQIGTKSKEFMQSAGKMGKGLFNKGKSKLRGTGDKESKKAKAVTGQAKAKHERRTSWGLNIGGGRSRTDSAGPQSGQRNVSATTTTTTTRRSGTPPPPPQARQGGATTWSNRPSHDSQSPALPNNSPPLSQGQGQGDRMAVNDNREFHRTGPWQPVTIGRPSMDQVSIDSDRQPSVGGRSFSPEPAYNRPPHRAPFAAIPEDSGVALPPDSDVPKRTSFVGLPPIRRNSTLGSFDFLGDSSSELHSFLKFDDDGKNAGGTAAGPSDVDKALPSPPPSTDPVGDATHPNEETPVMEPEASAAPVQVPAPAPASIADQHGPPPQEPAAVYDPQETAFHGQGQPLGPVQPAEPEQAEPVLQPSHYQRTEENARLQPQDEITPAPLNPIHTMLPAGWNLQESYLVEPLNSVSRNRGGTSPSASSPPPVGDGFEKETGLGGVDTGTLDAPPSTPPNPQKNAEAPPSSAHRYPSLFPPQRPANGVPRSPGQGKGVAQEDYHKYMITQSRGARPNGSSSHVPEGGSFMDESPAKEKKLAGLRNMGQRLAAATSRDGRSATPEPRPESPDIRGDEVSESSVALDGRKKKRSSLLPGFRHANNTDVSLPLSRETSHNRAPTPDSFARSDAAESHSERKRWLGSAVGAIAAKSPLKFAQSGGTPDADNQAHKPATQAKNESPSSKSKLATLKMANLASKFNRGAQSHGRKPSGSQPIDPTPAPLARVPETRTHPNVVSSAGTEDGPAPPDSPSSIVFPPHPAVGETSQARHKRQASASGIGAEAEAQRPVSRPQAKDEPTPRKPSGGSLSPTYQPGAAGSPHANAPPHGPPQQPLPSIPKAPGSSRDVSLEGGRPSKEFENPRASPRAPDFSVAQKSPPTGSFPRPSIEKPSTARQAMYAHERRPSDQRNRPSGPKSPGFVQTRNAPSPQPDADISGSSRALAASPEPPAKPDGHSRQAPTKGRPLGNEHIAMLQQSPKPSVDLTASSIQPTPVPTQQGGPVKPVDGAAGAKRPGQTGGQGSLWKGLRSRMSEQISHATPRVQGKAEATSAKLLGAIKRGQADRGPADQAPAVQAPMIQASTQGQQPSQWRPTQTSQNSPPPTQSQFQTLPKMGRQQAAPPHGPAQQRQGEPQYAQVPIPQGYHAVRGEGRVAPSPYNVGQQQQLYNPQQTSPQGYTQQQWAAGHGQNTSPTGQNAAPYHQAQPDNGDRRTSAIHGAGYIAGQPAPSFGAPPVQDTGVNGQTRNSPGLYQGGQYSQSHLQSPPSMSDQSSLDRHPSQVSQTSMQTSASSQAVNGQGSKSVNAPNLGIDVQKAQQDKEVNLYDVTPKAVTAPAAGGAPSVNIELEDTEEARKRTIRLEAQEDKILADPEEEAPQMSATSYPGQMWNPYGMEFVDWRDDER